MATDGQAAGERGAGPGLAVLISFSGLGGVERMTVNLLQEIGRRGLHADILLIRRDTFPGHLLPACLRAVDLGVRHSALSVVPLAAYLRRHAPAALLAVKDRAIRAALLARRLARCDTRLVGRLGTHLSESLRYRSRLSRWLRVAPMRYLYRDLDVLVGISRGVVEDAARLTGLPAGRLRVIPNPVVTPELLRLAAEPLDDPWLPGPVPVLIGVGRLTRQKDFPTLIHAFALVRAARECRLLVVGEGEERPALAALVAALGLGASVRLVGHQRNPYPHMARASLLVLSSRWEGLGNVLVEALALGTPVVSTDCPSGPRELLQGGRYGRLVPPGDPPALAEAILHTLDHALAKEDLRRAAEPYTASRSADLYLQALGWPPG
jgi:glycosyltransferase involved in cell wall biosynthesis